MVSADAAPPAYSESVSPLGLTLVTDPAGKEILITVKPPAEPIVEVDPSADIKKDEDDKKDEKEKLKDRRAPVDFVLTIDVSGSMASEAPVPGDNERTGLSVLDVVKHAAKTIITTMKPTDRIAIVSFSSNGKVVLPLTHTDEAGKKEAVSQVEALCPLDSTNLWDGLKLSMEVLTGAPAVGDSTPSAVSRLANATSALAAGIVNIAVGTQLPRPEYGSSQNRLASIFLLTDGLPNVEPPRGHIPMLERYLESNPKSKFSINTFGFGYSLDSRLLNDIARIGGGHFGFIPDSGMVGTNFVHVVANTYATYADGLYVDIEAGDGKMVKEMEVPGSFEPKRASWGIQIPLGQLQYGQTRDIVVRIPSGLSKAPVTVTARCRPWNSDDEIKTSRAVSNGNLPSSDSPTEPNLLYHGFRLELVSAVHKEMGTSDRKASRGGYMRSISLPQGTKTVFEDLASRITAAFPDEAPPAASASADARDLAEDVSGQVVLGVDDQAAFNRWGLHYLLSLSRSHQRQQCGNFKDPGLQGYGRDSPLFKTARDEIDTAFDNLPAPTPSLTSSAPASYTTSSSAGGVLLGARAPPAPAGFAAPGAAAQAQSMYSGVNIPASAPAPKFKMSRYNSRSAPCFAGSSRIVLGDGQDVRIDSLRAGDTVRTPAGNSKVVGIVKTIVEGGSTDLCNLGDGLLITPWHPIYKADDQKWQFPADVATPQSTACDAVYSLLLEGSDDSDAHAVFIGGIRCVTLGHGVVDPMDVRAHPFLSNYAAVKKALFTAPMSNPSYAEAVGTRRDADTGLICGFLWKDVPSPMAEEECVECASPPCSAAAFSASLAICT